MKSEKCKKFIEQNEKLLSQLINENSNDISLIDRMGCEVAVEIAEKEMIEKAIQIHRSLCSYIQACVCDDDCKYMKKFIEMMND